jgi:hypothetical protein
VVVQLLASVGGKLDVMTHTGKGTTFWAHFPLSKERALGGSDTNPPTPVPESEPRAAAEGSEALNQVVTIRKSEGG